MTFFLLQDYSVDFDEKLKPLTDEEQFDVDRFLSLIFEEHQEKRIYRPSPSAIEILKEVQQEFNEYNADSGFG